MTEEEERYVIIRHGKLTIRMPRKIFRGRTAVFDETRMNRYREILSARYPWLSHYALDEIFDKARRARERQLVESGGEVGRARELVANGNLPMALETLDRYLQREEEDADAWYLRAEVLCRLGRQEEGYRSISRARKLVIHEK